MIMDIHELPVKDNLSGEQIEYLAKKQHEYKHIGKMKKVAGHILFSFNRQTKEIKPAKFEREVAIDIYGKPIYKERCVIEPNCYYEQALNVRNFIKRLKRLGIIE
jgi:hypothetical protein